MVSGETSLTEALLKKLVEIHGLTVTYAPENGSPLLAVDGVSLEIRSGEVVGLMGESGSGKSTFAASILRLLPVAATCRGAIQFEGRNLLEMKDAELRRVRGASIAMIPQDPAACLNPVIRAGEQIAEVLRAHFRMNRSQRKIRVKELLKEVRFDDPERIYAAYPHELSGGQRQRVAIAQAIACRPALLIADEPTSKLDPAVQAEILALLQDLVRRDSTAMLLITHDPAILAGFADRVVVMYAGRIVECGRTEDIFHRSLHPYTQGLLRLATASSGSAILPRMPFLAIAGEPPTLTRTEPGCRFEPRCPARLDPCSRNDPPEFASSEMHRVNCFLYGN
jgi:oligopeptide/dipeptide ABC transporter ATP-binding protein